VSDLTLPTAFGLTLEQAGGVLTITFDRPELGNPIGQEQARVLTTVFEDAAGHQDTRVVVVRGAGRHLSTGGDVSGFAASLALCPAERAEQFRERLAQAAKMVEAVLAFDRPIVTIHRGAAAGAAMLFCLAADVTLADSTACFVFSHQRVGLPPDGGVSILLPLIVGWRTAKRLILTAAKVEAEEAVRIGLLDSVLPADALDEEAKKLARHFASAPQNALRSAKRVLNAPHREELAAGLRAETQAIAEAVADDDFVEGVTAFLEKRRAVFPSAR